MSTFEFDLQLTRDEQAHLAAIKATPGFEILNRIAKAEIDKFFLRLINTDPSEESAVRSYHIQAKTAAQIYTAFTNAVNESIFEYANAPKKSDKPIDTTEGILDLDYSRGLQHSSWDSEEI